MNMRRWILLPVIAGLLLSMIPSVGFAQQATPVAEQSASTWLQIDGQTNHLSVPVGTEVTLSSTSESAIGRYTDKLCSTVDTAFTGSTAYTESFDIGATYWYRAYLMNDAGIQSDCLSVTWQAPVMASRNSSGDIALAADGAPTLTLNGRSENVVAPTNYAVTAETDNGAALRMYLDSTSCQGGDPGTLPDNPWSVFIYDHGRTAAFEAFWPNNPDAPVSDCYVGIWYDSLPIMIDGVAESKTVLLDQPVNIQTEPWGELVEYAGSTTCDSDGINLSSSTRSITASNPMSYSYKAVWAEYPDAQASNCFTITWANAPTLTLNGTSGDANVEAMGEVAFAHGSDTDVVVYSTQNCTGPEVARSELNIEMVRPAGTVYSAHAETRTNPPLYSDCYVARWLGAPVLRLNDTEADATVAIGEQIIFTTDAGAHLQFFPTLDCSDTASSSEESGHSHTATDPIQFSVRAVSDFNSSITSGCFVASWVATPVLTLNGHEGNVVLDVGEELVFTAENDAHLVIFQSEDCTGVSETFGAEHADTQTLPTTMYVRAVSNLDGSFTSDCFEATWTKMTTVRVDMWDDSSLEGASWSLYAPTASQVAGGAYLTGELNDLNTVEFIDLPAGEYRFVVEPAGQDTLEFSITVSNDSESLVLQVAQPLEPATPEPTSVPGTPAPTTAPVTPEPTTVPGAPVPTEVSSTPLPATPTATVAPGDPAPTVAPVTGLPETGSGTSSSTVVLGLASVLAAAVILAAVSNQRRHLS